MKCSEMRRKTLKQKTLTGRTLRFLINMVIKPYLTLSLPESNLESINLAVPCKSVDETRVCDHSNESY